MILVKQQTLTFARIGAHMICFWVGDEVFVPSVYIHGCTVVLFVS